jgi:predicted ATP-grasp superfamily ATP-dependent carboligase
MAELEGYVRVLETLETQQLRRPYAMFGFGGWIDASWAASGAVRYLVAQLSARQVAEVDPELFYSFTDTRPRVRVVGPGQREPRWRRGRWFVARMSDELEHDLVLFTGPEPNLRWRTFTSVVLEVLEQLGTELIVSLGSVLAPVHHRSRVSLRGWATTEELRTALGARHIGSSNYEGPTGITTVLLAAAQERGLAGLSVSASAPNYLANVANPRVSIALLRAVSDVTGVPFPLGDLERQGRSFERQVEQSVASQPGLREALEQLAETADEPESETNEAQESAPGELPSSATVLHDLEAFLRDLRQQDGGGSSSN